MLSLFRLIDSYVYQTQTLPFEDVMNKTILDDKKVPYGHFHKQAGVPFNGLMYAIDCCFLNKNFTRALEVAATLAANCNVNATFPKYGTALLYSLEYRGYFETAQMLVTKGADIDQSWDMATKLYCGFDLSYRKSQLEKLYRYKALRSSIMLLAFNKRKNKKLFSRDMGRKVCETLFKVCNKRIKK